MNLEEKLKNVTLDERERKSLSNVNKNKQKRPKEKKRGGKEKAADNQVIFEDILSDKEAAALIHDLVNIYTSDEMLTRNELKSLKSSLCEKTASVLMFAFDACADKIYNKLLENENFMERLLQRGVTKKDASCQCDFQSFNDSRLEEET